MSTAYKIALSLIPIWYAPSPVANAFNFGMLNPSSSKSSNSWGLPLIISKVGLSDQMCELTIWPRFLRDRMNLSTTFQRPVVCIRKFHSHSTGTYGHVVRGEIEQLIQSTLGRLTSPIFSREIDPAELLDHCPGWIVILSICLDDIVLWISIPSCRGPDAYCELVQWFRADEFNGWAKRS